MRNDSKNVDLLTYNTYQSLRDTDFRGVHGGRSKKSSEEEFFEDISFMRRNHYRKYVEILFKLLLNYPKS